MTNNKNIDHKVAMVCTEHKLYDRVVLSSHPSQNPDAVHGCEPIYILSAVNVEPVTEKSLKQEFEVTKILHPIWKNKTLQDFIDWKAEMHQIHYNVETYDTAYFLNPLTATKYATANMADINESGSYPYLVIYTRPTDHMYSESYESDVTLFEYNADTDQYEEIHNLDKKPEYKYIVAAFNFCTKLPDETKA